MAKVLPSKVVFASDLAQLLVEIRSFQAGPISSLEVVVSKGWLPGPEDDLGVVDVPADVQGELVQDLVDDFEESFDFIDSCGDKKYTSGPLERSSSMAYGLSDHI